MGLNSIPPSIQDLIAPVGSIIEWAPVSGSSVDLSTAQKVHDYYGFGTWAAYGEGKVTACVTSGHAAGSTEGERTHTLTVDEMPNHTHGIYMAYGANDPAVGFQYASIKSNGGDYGTGYISPTGGSAAHNNMQPTIYIYRWQRTA